MAWYESQGVTVNRDHVRTARAEWADAKYRERQAWKAYRYILKLCREQEATRKRKRRP